MREERCLIRKAAAVGLKTPDKLISKQDPFQEAFAGLDTANFHLFFLSKSQLKCAPEPRHVQTKRQR